MILVGTLQLDIPNSISGEFYVYQPLTPRNQENGYVEDFYPIEVDPTSPDVE
jgi:hypothetical protein